MNRVKDVCEWVVEMVFGVLAVPCVQVCQLTSTIFRCVVPVASVLLFRVPVFKTVVTGLIGVTVCGTAFACELCAVTAVTSVTCWTA